MNIIKTISGFKETPATHCQRDGAWCHFTERGKWVASYLSCAVVSHTCQESNPLDAFANIFGGQK